jgi:hypothetical protein
MLTSEEAARRVIALADRVRDLSVRRRSPDAFFEERSEIDSDLRKLAADIAGKPFRGETAAERSAFAPGAVRHKGRSIPVTTRGARRTAERSLLERTFA